MRRVGELDPAPRREFYPGSVSAALLFGGLLLGGVMPPSQWIAAVVFVLFVATAESL